MPRSSHFVIQKVPLSRERWHHRHPARNQRADDVIHDVLSAQFGATGQGGDASLRSQRWAER